MAGTFGYELDPLSLTGEEKEQIRQQIKTFQKYYDLIQYGDYFRLTDPFLEEGYHAWEFADTDGKEALVSVVATKQYANKGPVYIRLRGLKEKKIYRMNQERYLGAALMYAGIRMPEASREYESWNLHFVEE